MRYRPCLFHESEGGGIKDEDLENDVKLAFIANDCITTKEVLLRLFYAKSEIEIGFSHGSAMKNISLIQEKFKKYPFCVIYMKHAIIADAIHYMTMLGIDNQIYLIQSYLDRYSYNIKIYDNAINLINQICTMFDKDDRNIALSILEDVQVPPERYQEEKRNITTEILKFEFYTVTIDSNMTLSKALSLMQI